MTWTKEAKLLIKQLEPIVLEKYKVLKHEFNKETDKYIIESILIPNCKNPLDVPEVYAFYTLKIYEVIDKYLMSHYYFDQIYGDFPVKGVNFETNMYNSDNEIFNIADEFGLKIKDKIAIIQIFGRLRFLASRNIYNSSIVNNFMLCKIEYENPKYYEKENFRLYFKNYVNKHPKYLRYLDLLRKVLVKSYYFRTNIFIALTEKDLIKVLEDPFIWVMLEPYNHILN
jgi:hypothetical protein